MHTLWYTKGKDKAFCTRSGRNAAWSPPQKTHEVVKQQAGWRGGLVGQGRDGHGERVGLCDPGRPGAAKGQKASFRQAQ